MKVIILAAGNASRLASLANGSPKCLLPLGDTTILGKQLRNLEKVGLMDVILSVGYKVEKIEEYLRNFQTNLKIYLEFNPFYDISNNIISLWNVRHLVWNQPIIIINGDNVFKYQVLSRLLESPFENVLMIQEKEEYDGDDMKVKTENDRLLAVNKTMKSSEATGESIGIMKFSAEGCTRLMQKIVEMIRDKENLQVWYLRSIQELINDGLPIHVCQINGLKWEEVDFPEDYLRVKNMNWENY
ncbi:MAG TPA: phosphocholine cytidylyltransferase family protein [Candidatus Marinimicrobia bacterium]|nr:phosphocholine cytidylyltransferase family protein [Candidatus Neomarinimicrobiota bacterium]HRS52124.1 phosphocholine cytidylyltransferase family protein [Candidatus Neomarinimicrobiota bacterium]HRU92499.1 phosphocholine cytidylyltransferase family protein [Candidatus Neomarinimicrobiota bacterium]